MDCGGFDPSDSDAVKGKGSSRVGKEERERERERGGQLGRPWEGGGQERQMLRG